MKLNSASPLYNPRDCRWVPFELCSRALRSPHAQVVSKKLQMLQRFSRAQRGGHASVFLAQNAWCFFVFSWLNIILIDFNFIIKDLLEGQVYCRSWKHVSEACNLIAIKLLSSEVHLQQRKKKDLYVMKVLWFICLIKNHLTYAGL